MSEVKRVLNYTIESSEQLVSIVNGLTNLKVDLDVDATPSSIEIRIKGQEHKVRKAVNKIKKIVEKSRTS